MKPTIELKNKIANLENEVTESVKDRESLIAELAAKYEKGQDPAATLKKLSECRDSITGMVSALRNLDKQLEEVQKADHIESAERLDRETHKKFEAVIKAAAGALKPLCKSLTDVIAKDNIQTLTDKLIEVCKAEIWAVMDAESSDRYADEVPPMPGKVQPRNDDGIKQEIPLEYPVRS